MNNKEKAEEIAWNNSLYNDNQSCAEQCFVAALEMAQWKDEQFSKFLLWLDDYYVIRRFDDGEPMTYAELIDNFQSMEQQ